MSFLPTVDCAKRLPPSLPVLPGPFCLPQGSTDGALQVGFSFLPVLRKSGRSMAGRGSFQLHANSLMAGIPHALPLLQEDGGKAVKFSGVSLSETHPPAVRCASIAANTEPGSRNTPAVIRRAVSGSATPSVWCEVHAVAVVYCEIKGIPFSGFVVRALLSRPRM